jgi:uncharacterized protein (DUF2342 family)
MSSHPQPRRRFQYRLRSLLIGVALLAIACGYVARQAEIVSERRAMLDWINMHNGSVASQHQSSPIAWVRQLLGDRSIAHIALQPDTDRTEVQRIRRLFPEADIRVVEFGGFQG